MRHLNPQLFNPQNSNDGALNCEKLKAFVRYQTPFVRTKGKRLALRGSGSLVNRQIAR